MATVLTLVITPSLLAIRVWTSPCANWIARLLARISISRASRAARDWALQRDARRLVPEELIWTDRVTEPARADPPLKPAG